MAQYFTDFSSATVDAAPAGWTPRWGSDASTWTVVEDAGATGGKALKAQDSSDAQIKGLSLDAVDTDEGRANSEVVLRWKSTGFLQWLLVGAFVRGSGATHATSNLYYGQYNHGSTGTGQRRIGKRIAGAITTIQNAAYTVLADTWYWTRCRVNGTTISVKHWEDGETEPEAWTFTSTQTNVADGWAGVFIGANSSNSPVSYIDLIGIGTDGDAAPTSAPSSTPVSFAGTVSNQTGAEGVAFSLSLASHFSGTETPFAYSVQSGTLPAGLSLSSSTGAITGTPTTAGTSSGIVVRATDSASNTADTNAFSITIDAALSPPSSAPGSTVANAVSSSQIDVYFAAVSGAEGYEIERDGEATPLDLGNVLTYSHTGLSAASPHAYRVRAYNAAGDGPWSASFGDTTDAETVAVKGVTVTLYSGSTPRASITGIRALWWDATVPDATAPHYYTATASTDASGALTLDLDAATGLAVGDYGYLLLHKDGTAGNLYRDALAFQGAVQITDIS